MEDQVTSMGLVLCWSYVGARFSTGQRDTSSGSLGKDISGGRRSPIWFFEEKKPPLDGDVYRVWCEDDGAAVPGRQF